VLTERAVVYVTWLFNRGACLTAPEELKMATGLVDEGLETVAAVCVCVCVRARAIARACKGAFVLPPEPRRRCGR